MKSNIIGRKNECDLLKRIYESDEAEFLAVCGRRRVGKTFLIREFFEGNIVFTCSGIANSDYKMALRNFTFSLKRYSKDKDFQPCDWLDAFEMLIDYLSSLPEGRKIVFLDELPWMDTPGSDFLSALEHFWNSWASARKDIVLIVCGSATSWMMDHLIHEHGGLYGRLTHQIILKPFDLRESEIYLNKLGFALSRYEIAEYYMIMGGIPYYLRLLDSRLSLTQNIDRLLFNPDGELYDEFNHLYKSLFTSSDDYIKVVSALSKKGYGLTRNDIIEETKLKTGKKLSKILDDLESCGFIRKYYDYQRAKTGFIYQLIDFYTLFYFKFIKKSSFRNLQYWSSIQGKSSFYSWAGITYELLALLHEEEIKEKIGIRGVYTNSFAWRSKKSEDQCQIDLIIDRGDNTINICEMKFSEGQFQIDKNYEMQLRNKLETFRSETKTKKSLQLTMVTAFGIKNNSHSGIVTNEVVLDDLFQ